MALRVLMFGWEFPPMSSGGLGTACFGLTKGLKSNDVSVTFVVPRVSEDMAYDHVRIIGANEHGSMRIIEIDSILRPYINSKAYSEHYKNYLSKIDKHSVTASLYGEKLHKEVERYSEIAKKIASEETYDIIHAHDWMTYQAAINAKSISGKPLVVHVHATEFDRSGDHPDDYVYCMEKKGMESADKIIAVSEFTKQKIIRNYGIDPSKISVVYNAVEHSVVPIKKISLISGKIKKVLFLGRITMQKGPDYFLYAASRVLSSFPFVRFIMAGHGDMDHEIIRKAAELGIADKVLFTGFLSREETIRAYQGADLYVLPSVSEPFGITPLEALANNTPVLISRQSGVSEVLTNALKVDFWDVDEMANKILSVLRYPSLHKSLQDNGSREVKKFSWDNVASEVKSIYSSLVVH